MTGKGERRCALLLAALDRRDRRRLLARLPRESARTIRALVAELERMRLPLRDVVHEVLEEDPIQREGFALPEADRLLELSRQLPPTWFARVLCAWPGIDRSFFIALLEAPVASEVERHIAALGLLPPKLADAVKREAGALLAAPVEVA